jgi:hypothetical protein
VNGFPVVGISLDGGVKRLIADATDRWLSVIHAYTYAKESNLD